MARLKEILLPAGMVVGGVLVIGSYVLSGITVIRLGLPFWAWQAIGAAIFFACIIAVVYHRYPRRSIERPSSESPRPTAIAGGDAKDASVTNVNVIGDGIAIDLQRSERLKAEGITHQQYVTVPKQPSPELVIEIHDYDFGFGGGGYPPKRFDDDNALWLRLGVTFKMNQTMRIETFHLLLSGEPIQPHDWAPGQSAYYYYFEMPQWAKPDEVRTIQLVAFAKGTKWGSEEKEIRITFPPQ